MTITKFEQRLPSQTSCLRAVTVAALFASGAFVWRGAARAQTFPPPTVRNYQVNRTAGPPVIDGSISPSEWDAAARAADDWRELRQPVHTVDSENNRFRMLWDNEALYVLYETDRTVFPARRPGSPPITFEEDTLNLYFDPNKDGDPNFVTIPEPLDPSPEPPGLSLVDGYQFGFNQVEGRFRSTDANRQGVGFFTEAHVNALFGNQANWGGEGSSDINADAMQNIEVAQSNNHFGGLAEIMIPWSTFNADAQIEVNTGRGDTMVVDTGLYHPFAPPAGDTWLFNMSSIHFSARRELPVWNWTPSDFFAARPHGQITFVPEASLARLAVCWLVGLALLRKTTRNARER